MKNTAIGESAARPALIWLVASLLASAAVAAYVVKLRPWALRWGTDGEEASAPLPGDAIVPSPRFQATHAVTIDAPAESVWPWLVQMGATRGGFYTYDWLEQSIGLKVHSVDHILPEYQHLQQGDLVANSLERPDEGLEVAVLERNRALVYHAAFTAGRAMARPEQPRGEGWFHFTWGFFLKPVDADSCRLIARTRIDYTPSLQLEAFRLVLEPQHFIMQRKMLLGIKARAERLQTMPLSEMAYDRKAPATELSEPG